MVKDIMTFEDIQTDILKSGYKSVCLFTEDGKQLISWNSTKVKLNQRIEEVGQRLRSKSTEEGIYLIKAKYFGRNAEPSIYYTSVGNPDKAVKKIEVANSPSKKPKIMDTETYNSPTVPVEKYQETYMELIEAQGQVQLLQMEVDRHEATIEDLEKELDSQEGKGGMLGEENRKFLDNAVTVAVPVIEKYLEQRSRALRLQELQYYDSQNGRNGHHAPLSGPPEEEEEPQITEEEEMQLQLMEKLKEDNPVLYSQMMNEILNPPVNDAEV